MYLDQGFKGKNDWWRFLIGILVVFTGYFIGQLPLFVVLMSKFSASTDLGTDDLESFQNNMDFEVMGINKNFGFILLILMFLGAILALWLVVKYLHQKKVIDLVIVDRPVQYHKIFFGFVFWMILTLILEGVYYFYPYRPVLRSCFSEDILCRALLFLQDTNRLLFLVPVFFSD
jgi:uncharacterized protein